MKFAKELLKTLGKNVYPWIALVFITGIVVPLIALIWWYIKYCFSFV